MAGYRVLYFASLQARYKGRTFVRYWVLYDFEPALLLPKTPSFTKVGPLYKYKTV